jgi:hypothetical protein
MIPAHGRISEFGRKSTQYACLYKIDNVKVKVKQSLYTLWRRLGGKEV